MPPEFIPIRHDGDVPHPLSAALDTVLDGLPADPLRRATASLIDAYRSGAPPTAQVLRDPTTAAAYAAYRMPATHAAVARTLRHATDLAPGLDVRTVVDVGGGTGAATWAVAEAFPALERATVLDGSTDALALGARIGRHGPPVVAGATWSRALLGPGVVAARAPTSWSSATCSASSPSRCTRRWSTRRSRRRRSWCSSSSRAPLAGTPPCWRRGHGSPTRGGTCWRPARRTAPARWPPGPGDWCHFAVRLDRSALHRRVKGGRLGHEDEKFSYVLASRAPVTSAGGRVLRHPVTRKGLVQLEVCDSDGSAGRVVVTKRDPIAYRAARDASWGDTWSVPGLC